MQQLARAAGAAAVTVTAAAVNLFVWHGFGIELNAKSIWCVIKSYPSGRLGLI